MKTFKQSLLFNLLLPLKLFFRILRYKPYEPYKRYKRVKDIIYVNK